MEDNPAFQMVKIGKKVTKSISPKKTKEIARELAKSLKGGETIALFGDLGAGKTVFVQGLAKALKIKTRITSPTFVLMKTYPAKVDKKEITFYHLDLYRIENPQDLKSLDLDGIASADSVVAIEWAEKLGKFLPKKRINIKIETRDEKTRTIAIERRI